MVDLLYVGDHHMQPGPVSGHPLDAHPCPIQHLGCLVHLEPGGDGPPGTAEVVVGPERQAVGGDGVGDIDDAGDHLLLVGLGPRQRLGAERPPPHESQGLLQIGQAVRPLCQTTLDQLQEAVPVAAHGGGEEIGVVEAAAARHVGGAGGVVAQDAAQAAQTAVEGGHRPRAERVHVGAHLVGQAPGTEIQQRSQLRQARTVAGGTDPVHLDGPQHPNLRRMQIVRLVLSARVRIRLWLQLRFHSLRGHSTGCRAGWRRGPAGGTGSVIDRAGVRLGGQQPQRGRIGGGRQQRREHVITLVVCARRRTGDN
ncbi:hypothetical protein [Streptomyces minutiscleroticus]|uniref:hypothetical protein n=1 Tax=Streptomyces minutiscleroticus TaxID=68238 RepID=UPI0027E485B7|nr:hypothetical protein [Streptomyces minutiscleroticus]